VRISALQPSRSETAQTDGESDTRKDAGLWHHREAQAVQPKTQMALGCREELQTSDCEVPHGGSGRGSRSGMNSRLADVVVVLSPARRRWIGVILGHIGLLAAAAGRRPEPREPSRERGHPYQTPRVHPT
jgi:hypothetical protein